MSCRNGLDCYRFPPLGREVGQCSMLQDMLTLAGCSILVLYGPSTVAFFLDAAIWLWVRRWASQKRSWVSDQY